MLMYFNKPITLIKAMKGDESPFIHFSYADLDLCNLPSRDYHITNGIKRIHTCIWGFHACYQEGIIIWINCIEWKKYIVEVHGLVDFDDDGKIAAEYIKFIRFVKDVDFHQLNMVEQMSYFTGYKRIPNRIKAFFYIQYLKFRKMYFNKGVMRNE